MSDLMQQAVAAHRANDLGAAARLYRAALDEQPARADAWFNLGTIQAADGQLEAALASLRQAVTRKPDFTLGWFQYGLALSRAERDAEALAAYDRALALDPTLTGALVNSCYSAKNDGQFDRAEAAIRQALAQTNATLAVAEAAEQAYTALHWHLALIELLRDRYDTGFAYFRARFKGGTDWRRTVSDRPLWRGEDLTGKTILITAEQGFGDMLMMARYLPLLTARGAIVWLEAHDALLPLFAAAGELARIGGIGSLTGEPYDYHAPIFDLPYVFGTRIDTIPSRVPYLPQPAPTAATQLPATGQPRIGVIWAGQPGNRRGLNRSIPLDLFARLVRHGGCDFISLTRDLREGEAAQLAALPVMDSAPALGDFAATAAAIGQCDLIVTIDTAVAHLAGGLGKPVWVLLPAIPDWRWGLERADCPWYPSARLFRQPRHGDWTSVIAAVAAALQEFKPMTEPPR